MWQLCRCSKEERWVSGVGIDHMRCHVISQRNDEGHVIRHVTYPGASEDLHKSTRLGIERDTTHDLKDI